MFRIAKFLIEYQKINNFLKNSDKTPVYKLILQIVPRVAYFFYWIIDTFVVLAKINFLKNWDQAKLTYYWAAFWTVANFTTALGCIVELFEIAGEEAKVIAARRNLFGKTKKTNVASDPFQQQPEKSTSLSEDLNALRAKEFDLAKRRFSQIIILIKALGDSITSTQCMGLPKKTLGFEFNDGLVGCGGFTSAALSCYQLYPAAKK